MKEEAKAVCGGCGSGDYEGVITECEFCGEDICSDCFVCDDGCSHCDDL